MLLRFPAFLFLILIFSLLNAAQTSLTKNEVLDAIYAAYGGKEKIAAVSAIRQEGRTFSTTRNNEANLTRIYRFPDYLKITKSAAPGQDENRILAADKGWRNGNPVEGMLKNSMMLQAMRMMVPRLLLEHEATLTYNGIIKTKDKREWHIFTVDLGKGAQLIVQVEPGTYHILATVGMMAIDEWRTMQFITTYEAFKLFDGLLFATKEHHYAQDKYVGWSNITAITFPKKLEASAFAP